jgi:hypothetical protein
VEVTWTLWFTLLALNVADVWTTSEVFSLGGYEANPLLGNSLLRIVLVKVAVLVVIFILMRRSKAPWIPYALLSTVVVYSIVVGMNLSTIASN